MVRADTNGAAPVSLQEFLADRARTATDARLAVDVSVGTTAFIVARYLRPEWWLLLASAGLVLFAFGAWAVLTRRIDAATAPPASSAFLKGARALIGWLGVAAAAGTLFSAWTIVMGTWIS
ncbi:MAG: hypothetical protein M3Z17_11025 [Gemmatimonadota bacterium]|nr:hypothetical protein [Gemmatimonadota bacterium]